MKKHHLIPLLVLGLSIFSFANPTVNTSEPIVVKPLVADSTVEKEMTKTTLASTLYDSLKLESKGLSFEALQYAIAGYQKLVERGMVQSSVLTIADMSQSSRKKRLYILDMQENKLIWNTFVSHGKNSGVDMATRFSNKYNSEATSLGFYITTQTYQGKHGLSLRLSGKEEGFNNNAEGRGVVVHGAEYVNAGRVNSAYMGRSQGCPALPMNEFADVINIIKGGSVFFVYHPSQNYLQASTLIRS